MKLSERMRMTALEYEWVGTQLNLTLDWLDWSDEVTVLEARIEALEKVLMEIAKGEGRFSRDRLIHALNTVEDMKALAIAVLTTHKGEEAMTAKSEIDRLAKFIMAEVPGEPSQSDGAGGTAIRIIRTQQAHIEELENTRGLAVDVLQCYDDFNTPVSGRLETAFEKLRAVIAVEEKTHG